MPTRDRWGDFPDLARSLGGDLFALVDARVARLHPELKRALPGTSLLVQAGERAKRLSVVERVLTAARGLSREGTFLAVGGGTVGDLATVAAHLHRRGVRLVLVPTTLLAAVDSSVGGKGAVNLGGAKNAAGVFHEASEVWLCPELLGTLSPAQLREGQVEALKMAVCLDRRLWRAWRAGLPRPEPLVRASRALKRSVCERDPREAAERRVLNFGHTFGHVLEALSGHRLAHGAAVRLGVVCALDVGRELGVTPATVAADVEARFAALGERPPRVDLARWLRGHSAPRVRRLLAADKKGNAGEVRMVLLEDVGRWQLRSVPEVTWSRLLERWKRRAVP